MAGINKDDVSQDWQKHATAGTEYEEGKWLEPGPNLNVSGVLTRAFVTKGKYDFAAAYEIREFEGDKLVFLGEKASMKKIMRRLHIGTEVKIIFKEKIMLEGREAWQVDIFSRPGKAMSKQTCADQILAQWKILKETGEDQVPF